MNHRIGFIGGGNMGGAMMSGIVKTGVCKPEQVMVFDVYAPTLEKLNRELGIQTTDQVETLIEKSDIIILAVKPQVLPAVLEEHGAKITTDKLVISIAAGKRLSQTAACEYLSEVGLCAKEYVNREINSSLSGGELKRIEIAMVNARSTPLTIFDEPEAGIDLWSFNSLIKVFENMYEKTKGNILIISHQERILNIADKIVVIANGQIKNVGKKEDVLPKLLGTEACRVLTEKM